MKNKISGLCSIINNEEFKSEANNKKVRTGSNKDVERLERLFNKLSFEVEIKLNRSKRLILETDLVEFIKKVKENETQYDAMVLIIMSHGKKDVIFGIDNREIKVLSYWVLFMI